VILFCDTSALIKLYVQEEWSSAMRGAVNEASVVAVCRVAWTEAMSALARRGREFPEELPLLERVRDHFRKDWESYAKVEVSQALVEQAGEFAEIFALRAYDSIQLTAANVLQTEMPGNVSFTCFDQRPQKAAQVLGLLPLDLDRLNQISS